MHGKVTGPLASVFCLNLLVTVLPAQPIVELDLIMRDRVSATAPQQWSVVLGRAGFSRPTIRSARPGDEFGIAQRGNERRPVYHVTGYMLGDDSILLPPRSKFGVRDTSRLAKWLSDLKENGPEGAGSGTTAFGLTPRMLGQVNEDLKQVVRQGTKGSDAAQVVKLIAQQLRYPLVIEPAARRAMEVDGAVRDELNGLSAGTALTAVLRPSGLVLRPQSRSGRLEYLVVDARQRGDNWPIGWASQQTPGKLIPQLFDRDDTVAVDVPLAAALAEISGRIKVPFLLDHNAMALNRIDPPRTMVSLKAGKPHYGGILNDLLRQARLVRFEARVDENKKPFLWITTLK